MSNSNPPNSIAQQLSERKARLANQSNNNNNNNNTNNPNNNTNSNSGDHLDDYEYAKRLQAQFNTEDNNHSDNNSNNIANDNMDDIEMMDNRNITECNNTGIIDKDHEIALHLSRQYEQEAHNVPPPNNHNHNHHFDYNPNHNHNRHAPHNNNLNNVLRHSYTNTNTNNNNNNNPRRGQSSYSTSTVTMHDGNGNIRTIHSNAPMNPMGGPMAGFNHPFFTQNAQMPGMGMAPMTGFNHPFFTNNNNNNANNAFSDPFFAQMGMNGQGMPQMGMDINTMMDGLMMGGGDGFPFAFMSQRAPVANQANVDALPTDTYKEKETVLESDDNDKEEKEEKQATHKESCSICLEEFKNGDEIRRLPCLHIFHKNEIDRWLLTGADKCPICRIPINGQTN